MPFHYFYERIRYMTGYIINAIALFIMAWLITKIPCCRNNRGELNIGKLLESKEVSITIGNTVYTARGFYKPTGKTLSEKLLRNMEKDLQHGKANISGYFGKGMVKYD